MHAAAAAQYAASAMEEPTMQHLPQLPHVIETKNVPVSTSSCQIPSVKPSAKAHVS
jgi:hypothetical protein